MKKPISRNSAIFQSIDKKIRKCVSDQFMANDLINSSWMNTKRDYQREITLELAEMLKGQLKGKSRRAVSKNLARVFSLWISESIIKENDFDFKRLVNHFTEEGSRKGSRKIETEELMLKIETLIEKASRKFFSTNDMCDLVELFGNLDYLMKVFKV